MIYNRRKNVTQKLLNFEHEHYITTPALINSCIRLCQYLIWSHISAPVNTSSNPIFPPLSLPPLIPYIHPCQYLLWSHISVGVDPNTSPSWSFIIIHPWSSPLLLIILSWSSSILAHWSTALVPFIPLRPSSSILSWSSPEHLLLWTPPLGIPKFL